MNYKLTNAEKETIIVFNEDETEAIISTCNPKMIRKLNSYCAKNAECCRIKSDEYGAEYKLPKQRVAIHIPPTITDAQRLKMASRAKDNFRKI